MVGTSLQEEEVDLYKYQPTEQDWPFESLDEMTERIAQGNFKMDLDIQVLLDGNVNCRTITRRFMKLWGSSLLLLRRVE